MRDTTGNFLSRPGVLPDTTAPIVRNVKSPHWRRWLGQEHRCLVPLTSFSEHDTVDGKKVPVWMRAPWAAALQRPLPDGMLQIVARAARHDG